MNGIFSKKCMETFKRTWRRLPIDPSNRAIQSVWHHSVWTKYGIVCSVASFVETIEIAVEGHMPLNCTVLIISGDEFQIFTFVTRLDPVCTAKHF